MVLGGPDGEYPRGLAGGILGEAFNIFNHPQFDAPDTTLGDGTFGQIEVQVGLKLLNNTKAFFRMRTVKAICIREECICSLTMKLLHGLYVSTLNSTLTSGVATATVP